MSFHGHLLAALAVKLPDGRGDSLTVEVELYRSRSSGELLYLERQGGEELEVLTSSSAAELIRLIIARQPRELGRAYAARTVFDAAGFTLDEGALLDFEDALDAIADEGEARGARRRHA
jgi:hypothetical protein